MRGPLLGSLHDAGDGGRDAAFEIFGLGEMNGDAAVLELFDALFRVGIDKAVLGEIDDIVNDLRVFFDGWIFGGWCEENGDVLVLDAGAGLPRLKRLGDAGFGGCESLAPGFAGLGWCCVDRKFDFQVFETRVAFASAAHPGSAALEGDIGARIQIGAGGDLDGENDFIVITLGTDLKHEDAFGGRPLDGSGFPTFGESPFHAGGHPDDAGMFPVGMITGGMAQT